MKKKVLIYLMVIVILGMVGLPEFSLLDWFLPRTIKDAIVISSMSLFSVIFILNYSFGGGGSFFLFGTFFCVLITLAQAFRAIYVESINVLDEITLLAHYLFSVVLLLYVLALHKYQVAVSSKVVRYVLVMLLFLVPLSFIAYLLTPWSSIAFDDHSGHHVYLIYGSLSSSINNLSGFSFPRLSLAFDEPGTFGALITLALGFLLARRQVNNKVLMFVLVVGLFSISMSYFIVASTIFIVYFCTSIVPLVLRANLYASLMMLAIVVIILATLVILRDSVLASYVVGRFSDIFQGNHNRASGNEMAISYAVQNPIGSPSSTYDDRVFPSSGMFVVTAYKGWIFSLAFIFTYALFFFKLHMLGYRVRYLVISIVVLLLSRNNLFNVSGAYLIAVASIMSSILGGKYDRKP